MSLRERAWVPFQIQVFIQSYKFKVLSRLSFYYAPEIRFKTAAMILAVEQHLLSYNTCRVFLILRFDNCSWILHLPGLIELTGSKSREMLQLAGEFLNNREL